MFKTAKLAWSKRTKLDLAPVVCRHILAITGEQTDNKRGRIMPLINRFQPIAFALFRIVFGLLFLQFGTQKLFAWPNAPTGYTPTPLLRAAAFIELICGLLIMIGLLTEFAAFVAAGEMAFAYFLGHFPIAVWPVVSKGVPAVLFCFAFLFIAAHGAGRWSLDNLWRKRSKGT
jgi:putative oxidoreductase